MKVPFALSDASPLFMLILIGLSAAVVVPYLVAFVRHQKGEGADADEGDSDKG